MFCSWLLGFEFRIVFIVWCCWVGLLFSAVGDLFYVFGFVFYALDFIGFPFLNFKCWAFGFGRWVFVLGSLFSFVFFLCSGVCCSLVVFFCFLVCFCFLFLLFGVGLEVVWFLCLVSGLLFLVLGFGLVVFCV